MNRKLVSALSFGAALFAAGQAQATLTIYTDEASYLAAITQTFSVDVGRDAAGNPLGATTSSHDGSDIFTSGGVDVNFSTDGVGASVTVRDLHPELGPFDGTFWSGSLRMDFSTAITAIGYGLHALDTYTLRLLGAGDVELASMTVDGGGFGFNGIVDNPPFFALIIDTDDTFWSLDGGRNASGPASSTEMVGQAVPAPSGLALLGLGLALMGGLAFRRRAG